MIKLGNLYKPLISKLLLRQEPWNIIALDAFMRYGCKHPEHHWYGEMINGKLHGIIYQHQQLIHLIYSLPLQHSSALYTFVQNHDQQFITHGKKEILEPFLQRLVGYRYQLLEHAKYVQQSAQTLAIVQGTKLDNEYVALRTAEAKDYPKIMRLYYGSSVDHLVDPVLIRDLINLNRVTVAEWKPWNKQLIGTIMTLKESPHYALLGGLYVDKRVRHRSVASLLGRKAILDCASRNKRVCFYYSDSALDEFYAKISLKRLGNWVTYLVTSKATT